MEDLIEEILALKRNRRALLLSHFYEGGEIQDVADAVGDSLFLAQKGAQTSHPVILLAGVYFMAESVKILSPEKVVLLPDVEAGCSLVKESPFEAYFRWRLDHPNHIMVTYVNSSALVKSISDVICTSSNAERVLAAIPEDRPILFGPDRNLGRYLKRKTGRAMELWPGTCEVHVLFSARKIFELKESHPDAMVLAHPECEDAVLDYADVVGSTSRLLEEVKRSSRKKFIVATEPGIFHQMKKVRPDAELIAAPAEGSCGCNECPYMKLNTLEKVRNALRDLAPEIEVDPFVAERAKISLDRMMRISDGQSVSWPTRFLPEAYYELGLAPQPTSQRSLVDANSP